MYAIRAGALDVPFERMHADRPDEEYSAVTLLVALWALAATGAVLYMYLRLP